LTKHEVVLRENDILRKEIATLAMKLQEAEEGVKAMDVDMVMSQVGCTRTRAVKALKDHDKDVIEAIMSLV
jgi:NACalpha-BTF3-like transcription factor